MSGVEEFALAAGLGITSILMPWVIILFSIIIALLVKDWSLSFIKGLRFKLSNEFNPGDTVLVDGEPSTIVSVGVTKTVFAKTTKLGSVWRYVPNERLAFLKLEKIIRPVAATPEELQKLHDIVEKDRLVK